MSAHHNARTPAAAIRSGARAFALTAATGAITVAAKTITKTTITKG
jgi:hypothetical protein